MKESARVGSTRELKRDDALDALQIFVNVERPTLKVNQTCDLFVLIEAYFQKQMPAGMEKARGVFNQPPDDAEAVAAGRQGHARLVFAHFAL